MENISKRKVVCTCILLILFMQGGGRRCWSSSTALWSGDNGKICLVGLVCLRWCQGLWRTCCFAGKLEEARGRASHKILFLWLWCESFAERNRRAFEGVEMSFGSWWVVSAVLVIFGVTMVNMTFFLPPTPSAPPFAPLVTWTHDLRVESGGWPLSLTHPQKLAHEGKDVQVRISRPRACSQTNVGL